MRFVRHLLYVVPALLIVVCLTQIKGAQAEEVDRVMENPLILYGNQPVFANNIVLTIDDNVYEGNIRWLLDILKAHDLKASFFPHTMYMVEQDPQVWRDLVADGHDIGYFTRKHEHNFTAEGFMEDFKLYRQELRDVLGDQNYEIRYAKPSCWIWDDPWLDWLDTANAETGILGARMNTLGPTEDMAYLQGLFNDTVRGGHLMSFISFTDQIEWFERSL